MKTYVILALTLLLCADAHAKQIVPCIIKDGRFWRTTKKQCLQLDKTEAEAYRAALERLKALEEFLRDTAPLIKQAQEEVRRLRDGCNRRESLLREAVKTADQKASVWKNKFFQLLKKKEAPVPFYKHPAFVFAAGVVLGGTITGVVAGIVAAIQRRN